MTLRPTLVLAACLCMAPDLQAQRPDFGPLRDSLAAITDVPLLYRMERAEPLPRTAPALEPLVRRGLMALRLWELTGDRDDAGRSKEAFEVATERFPAASWSHFGLALAMAEGPEIGLSLPGNVLASVTVGQSVAEIFGRDPRSNARRSLRRALELDPSFSEAGVLLADLAVMDGGRSRELIQEARDALRAIRDAGGNDARAARALAEMELALGNFAEAGAVAAATAGTGEDAGVMRTRAMALLLQPGSVAAGADAYWAGVDALTAEAAEQYYTDVEVLASPKEAAEWRAADLEGRRMWLRRFWETRAAEGGVTAGERLAEHYTRLTQARRRYVRNSGRGTDGVGVLLDGEGEHDFPFDDRGIVLIRHGEPMSIVRTAQRGTLPNESWYYELPGQGGQLFHFVARRGSQNFTLARDLLQAMDPAAGLEGPARVRVVLALVGDRAPYETRYQAVLPRLTRLMQDVPNIDMSSTEVRSLLEVADAEYRPGARAAMRTDTHVRRYAADLPFHHDVFTFRTPESRTDLTAAFAIPAGSVAPRTNAGGLTEYALRLSVIVTDTLLDVVTRRDTVHVLRFARALAADEMLRTNLSLRVQPSDDAVYRLVVADSASGRGRLETGSSPIRDYAARGLMVSDIVLAHPDSAGDWSRGNASFALALPRTFERERPFTVYYEVYNLAPDQSYSTRIVVAPTERRGVLGRIRGIFGGGGAVVNVRFDDVAAPDADGVVAETRRLASDLAPGTYRMVVTVTAAGGGSAESESIFTVEG